MSGALDYEKALELPIVQSFRFTCVDRDGDFKGFDHEPRRARDHWYGGVNDPLGLGEVICKVRGCGNWRQTLRGRADV